MSAKFWASYIAAEYVALAMPLLNLSQVPDKMEFVCTLWGHVMLIYISIQAIIGRLVGANRHINHTPKLLITIWS